MWMRRSSLGVGKLTRTHRLEVTLAMSGDPNRTSFELHLNIELAIWLAGGLISYGQRTLNGRSAYGNRLDPVAGVPCCGASSRRSSLPLPLNPHHWRPRIRLSILVTAASMAASKPALGATPFFTG
jgi:hypothetical protein